MSQSCLNVAEREDYLLTLHNLGCSLQLLFAEILTDVYRPNPDLVKIIIFTLKQMRFENKFALFCTLVDNRIRPNNVFSMVFPQERLTSGNVNI